MKRLGKLVAIGIVLVLAMSACERKEKVGSETLLKSAEDEAAAAALRDIVNSPKPTTTQAGAIENSPGPQNSPSPQKQRETIEIALVGETPYFQPGPHIRISGDTPIRIVNKDNKTRRFVTIDGPYDSQDLAPGRTFEFLASERGKFKLEDPNAPFIQGVFEVL